MRIIDPDILDAMQRAAAFAIEEIVQGADGLVFVFGEGGVSRHVNFLSKDKAVATTIDERQYASHVAEKAVVWKLPFS